ncbi:MAG: hypothetical protein MK207_05090 [Saprospiraceae bacterium]|nr:hypothetical protein [Saprospiraceae bacterium]
MKPKKIYHKDPEHKCGPNCDHNHIDKQIEDLQNFKEDKVKVKIIPEKEANLITFSNFINFFPPVELPFTITSDTQRLLSLNNDPLSAEWLFNFVLGKDDIIDEYTEYIACFSIPDTKDFFAIVYWEACLEGSTYYLTTFSKSGIVIDKSKIAGTNYKDDGLYQMVCTISPGWLFSCVEGKIDEKGNPAPISSEEEHLYKSLQLSGDGEIVPI